MIVYKVEISNTANADRHELMVFLRAVMSREGAHRYASAMHDEILSLAIYADCFGESRSQTIRNVHPHARRMVSHNRKWVYVFHLEEDTVVVDRILNAKMITR